MDLRSAGRRDHLHRVHLPPQAAAGALPAGRAPGPPAAATRERRAGRTSCSRCGVTTGSSPTPPCHGRGRRTHRDHAIIEQVIAELKDGPLAHLPSGKYAANAAWVACAVIAFNLARAAAVAADLATTRWATLRTKIINVPGGSPRPAAAWSCTSPTAGPANPAGNASGPSRPARHPCDPLDRQPRRAPSRTRSGKAGQTGSITTPSNKSI